MDSNKNKIKEILGKFIKRARKCQKWLFTFLFVVLVFDYFLFPLPALAQAEKSLSGASADETTQNPDQTETDELEIAPTIDQADLVKPANLPALPEAAVKKVKTVVVTAYNSEVGQCDSDPCTTASGFNVCEHGVEDTVATNSLPFGTKIRLPELFGNRIFTVRDRMNARYSDRFDVWMKDHNTAVKFGVKTAKIEIIN